MTGMRILHYMAVPSKRYNETFINMIHENFCFFSDDHIFWITTDESFSVSNRHKNVFLKKEHRIAQLNREAMHFDLIVIHGFQFKPYELLLIRKKTRRKMAWCVWGHDLYRIKNIQKGNLSEKMYGLMKNFIYICFQVPFVKSMKCIGIGFPYDAVEIKKWYGNTPIKRAPYGLGYNYDELKKLKGEKVKSHYKDNNTVNILLGHCGYQYLNHIKNLERLEKYNKYNIKVFLPLSYGDESYIQSIIDYCKNNSSRLKIEILTELMSGETYLDFLSDMDIAIFDYDQQAALGNIYVLLYFEKKIYLSDTGILYKGFKSQKISVYSTKDIGQVPYSEFINVEYPKRNGVVTSEKSFDNAQITEDWNSFFRYCLGREEDGK